MLSDGSIAEILECWIFVVVVIEMNSSSEKINAVEFMEYIECCKILAIWQSHSLFGMRISTFPGFFSQSEVSSYISVRFMCPW